MTASTASRIGITTTVPIEILFAAGAVPVDLNNIFVAHTDPRGLLTDAERAGFPQSACAWIKGLYGVIHREKIGRVIGVTEGDCSDTGALMEILESEDIGVVAFGYPRERTRGALTERMKRLADELGTTLEAAAEWKERLDDIRRLAANIDRCAWQDGTMSGNDLFLSLLACSDMLGDPDACRQQLQKQISQTEARPAPAPRVRLGCVGVPTIFSDLWQVLDGLGARVVYHETPQEFSRIGGIGMDLLESYLDFSYPYDVFSRLARVRDEIERRQIRGVIHYVQSFCHRQLHDRLVREGLGVPVLTLEGDRPGVVDGRARVRIEAFIEQLGGIS